MAARVFSVVYRSGVAQRILNGESVMVLSFAELKIKRSVLYRWRDAYRKSGLDGFKKTRAAAKRRYAGSGAIWSYSDRSGSSDRRVGAAIEPAGDGK